MAGEQSVVPNEVDEADYADDVRTVQAWGAVLMVLGAAGLCLMPLGLVRFHEGAIPGDPRIAFYNGMVRSISFDAVWLLLSTLTACGLSLLLFVGGMACLRLQWWARPVLTLWAVMTLICVALGMYFYVRWLLPPWRNTVPEVRGEVDMLVTFVGVGVATAAATVTLWLLNRRPVRDFFCSRHEIARRD